MCLCPQKTQAKCSPRKRLPPSVLTNIYAHWPSLSTDLYQLQRREKEEKDSSSGKNQDQEIYLLSVITTTFLFLFAVFVLIMLRRRRFKTEAGLDAESAEEDGHAMLLVLQHQNQPDLIRGDREKMQLITRISNFNANVLDHLVVRNEHLLSNTHSIDSGIATNNNTRSPGSAVATPRQQAVATRSVTTATTSEEDADSEPDYAEPVFATSTGPSYCPASCSPERRPPLPTSSPPSAKPSTHQTRHNSLDSSREFVARGYFARSRETHFE